MNAEEAKEALFETVKGKGRLWYKMYALCVLVCLCLILVYRATHIPKVGEDGRWAWLGLFGAELCFVFYWILTQSFRVMPIYHYTFKERLSQRHGNELPPVDIFVCTADPIIEPPMLVINTVLSVMAYDYPPEKLHVYVSDDGVSQLTFYGLLEAADFAKHWIPFCKRFKVEPRSPAAYFAEPGINDLTSANEFLFIKKLYKEMEDRVKDAANSCEVASGFSKKHKGFAEWKLGATGSDHKAIVQVLLDHRDQNVVDIEGNALPTLVYVSREKRPKYAHNFKAGAMNALIRVSSVISDSPFILNVDCDMSSNCSESVMDAMCFFMDEKRAHQIGYVQFPQNFKNLDDNNIYGDYISIANGVELPGVGDAMYIGTGCFHRRDSLCGKVYDNKFTDYKTSWKKGEETSMNDTMSILEEKAKLLASSTYEQNTRWGKDMGVMYGCVVEDVVTGMSIQCRGWKSIYFNPQRKGFLGISPCTLGQLLLMHKRWSEGLFQTFLSRFCPFIYGHRKINLKLQMAYSTYMLWSFMSLPTLYFVIVPSVCLLKGISLYPAISSSWSTIFMFVILVTHIYSLTEALSCGESFGSWWNMQRMKLFRRTSSYFFSLIDITLQTLKFSNSSFNISAKVADKDTLELLKKGIMDFGSSSPMFTVLATIAMINLLCLMSTSIRIIVSKDMRSVGEIALQLFFSVLLVIFNIPIYEGMFLRKDRGAIPVSVTLWSCLVAAIACLAPLYSKLSVVS